MKNFISALGIAIIALLGTTIAKAQTYNTGVGVLFESGDHTSYVGPHVKHFFSGNNAGEFAVLFADHRTKIQALYQYNREFAGANNLMWYLGVGPAVSFGNDVTAFHIVPVAGLDFKIPGAPLDLSVDWRPSMDFYDGGSDFAGGRFGAGLRFTF